MGNNNNESVENLRDAEQHKRGNVEQRSDNQDM
jgi:hypothetical protein